MPSNRLRTFDEQEQDRAFQEMVNPHYTPEPPGDRASTPSLNWQPLTPEERGGEPMRAVLPGPPVEPAQAPAPPAPKEMPVPDQPLIEDKNAVKPSGFQAFISHPVTQNILKAIAAGGFGLAGRGPEFLAHLQKMQEADADRTAVVQGLQIFSKASGLAAKGELGQAEGLIEQYLATNPRAAKAMPQMIQRFQSMVERLRQRQASARVVEKVRRYGSVDAALKSDPDFMEDFQLLSEGGQRLLDQAKPPQAQVLGQGVSILPKGWAVPQGAQVLGQGPDGSLMVRMAPQSGLGQIFKKLQGNVATRAMQIAQQHGMTPQDFFTAVESEDPNVAGVAQRIIGQAIQEGEAAQTRVAERSASATTRARQEAEPNEFLMENAGRFLNPETGEVAKPGMRASEVANWVTVSNEQTAAAISRAPSMYTALAQLRGVIERHPEWYPNVSGTSLSSMRAVAEGKVRLWAAARSGNPDAVLLTDSFPQDATIYNRYLGQVGNYNEQENERAIKALALGGTSRAAALQQIDKVLRNVDSALEFRGFKVESLKKRYGVAPSGGTKGLEDEIRRLRGGR